ncbi:MAG: creatininase family protein [Candidatus Hadarchaeaceae archaeon]
MPCPTALIPIGSVEQHGNHLPVFTDNYIALEVSRRAAERISKEFQVVVAPLVPFGKSTESKDWVGTISLEPITFIYLVRDICTSLAKMGFKKLVFGGCLGFTTENLCSNPFEGSNGARFGDYWGSSGT